MSADKKRASINKELTQLLYISAVVLLILLSILNMQNIKYHTNNVLGTTIYINDQELNKELLFWEEILSKHPTYYDGWKRISEIYLQLGEYDKSNDSINTAKKIISNY